MPIILLFYARDFSLHLSYHENQKMNTIAGGPTRTIALVLYLNSVACILTITTVILLVVQGVRLSNENYFALASFPNLLAFPLSTLNLACQLLIKSPLSRFSKIKILKESFNVSYRINRLSFVLSIIFILHHMNYGMWFFHSIIG